MARKDDGNLTVSGAEVSFTGCGIFKRNAIWSKGGTGTTACLDAFQRVATPRQDVEGAWQGRFKVTIEKTGEGTWSITAEVANIISCNVTEGADGKLVPGPITTTKMMPPPHLLELEFEVTHILENLTSFRREGETLVLEGGGKREIFTPAAGPGPARRDRVNKMR